MGFLLISSEKVMKMADQLVQNRNSESSRRDFTVCLDYNGVKNLLTYKNTVSSRYQKYRLHPERTVVNSEQVF